MTLQESNYCEFDPPPSLTSWFVPQHQQQVVQAMERAKQVTMGELNASIGVRELPPLLHSVCTFLF